MNYHKETPAQEAKESMAHERKETPEQEYMEHKAMERYKKNNNSCPNATEVIAKRKFK